MSVSESTLPRQLPPSLTPRPAMEAPAPRDLTTWFTRKRPSPTSPTASPLKRHCGRATTPPRRGAARAALMLAQTRSLLELTPQERLAWKEIAPLPRVREVFPFLQRGWRPQAPAVWLTWLEMALLYSLSLGRPCPRWVAKSQTFEGGIDDHASLPHDEALRAHLKGLQYLLWPCLRDRLPEGSSRHEVDQPGDPHGHASPPLATRPGPSSPSSCVFASVASSRPP